MGFKRDKKASERLHTNHTEEGRRRWYEGTRPDPRTRTVQEIKINAFNGASEAFAQRFEEHQDPIDEGRAKRAKDAENAARHEVVIRRIPKGWPSLREWRQGAALPPDDGKPLEY